MSTNLPNPTDMDAVRAWLAERQPNPTAVREWARPLLDVANRHGPIPALGGRAWHELANDDPRKLAALIPVALAWLDEHTPAAVADRLRRELDESDRLTITRLRGLSHDLSAAMADSKRRRSPRLSSAELTARRNTFPCLTCRRAPVVHPQTVCDACADTEQQPTHERNEVAA